MIGAMSTSDRLRTACVQSSPVALPTRRALIAGLGLTLLARPALAALAPTPREIMGPFYPKKRPQDHDVDLTWIAGRARPAKGRQITVAGRILDVKGGVVENAEVEIWQANHFGDYAARETGQPPRSDPGFQGFGAMLTRGDGAFSFRTIKPAAYDLGRNERRTPHIHFLVRAKGRRVFTTQMYFPGEALNARDILLRRHTPQVARDRMMARAAGGGRFTFDIILG